MALLLREGYLGYISFIFDYVNSCFSMIYLCCSLDLCIIVINLEISLYTNSNDFFCYSPAFVIDNRQ